ncbi:MAG: SDR family oxidoreductase, partial [Oscillospiraceae bacterium]
DETECILRSPNEQDAEKMVEETVKHFGRLDIALNNAGVMGDPAPMHELTKEKMDFTMQNNLYSVFYCAKAEIKQFLKQADGGVIVNNASIAGLTGLPGNPAYVASKHAVNGLTRNMALDYAKYGIRVNSVNPAGTDTPMVEQAMAFVMSKREQAIANGVPKEQILSMAGDKMQNIQHRNATPQEQAASMLFLASDDSTHLTGTLLATDGGWTAF